MRLRSRPLLAVAVLAWAGCSPRQAMRQMEPETVVYLVRHADRLDGSDDAPLSPAGEARARALADSVARWGRPERAFVTRFRRTVQTAALAAPHLAPIVYGGSRDAAADARALAEQVRTDGVSPVLVVAHSNTVPAFLQALDGRARPDLAAGDYDGVYVIRLRTVRPDRPPQAHVTRLRLGPDDGVPDPL